MYFLSYDCLKLQMHGYWWSSWRAIAGAWVLFMHSACTREMMVGSYKVWWRLVKWFLRNAGVCLQTVAGVVEDAVDEGLEASMSGVVYGKPLFPYSSWKEDSKDILQCRICQWFAIFATRKWYSQLQTERVSFISKRRRKKPSLKEIFAWLNFFDTCAAPASYCVNRFGCGNFLWLNLFTEQITICADIVKAATAEPLFNTQVGK